MGSFQKAFLSPQATFLSKANQTYVTVFDGNLLVSELCRFASVSCVDDQDSIAILVQWNSEASLVLVYYNIVSVRLESELSMRV